MSQAAIPFSFESYLQAKLTASEVVNMNRIVLANIPDLDHTIPIDRNETLPDESQIVYEQDVDQVGKVNSNAVVYSIVMDTSVGDFDFNAMYLIDKDQRTAIGMIVHKETETKTATDETSGVQGNSLVKSMLMQFDGAAAATNITVDAATWQIDYSARLKGMDEDVRIQALDIFGHDAFIGDGFKTTQSTGNQYFVESGEAYIGGLKAVLDGDVTLTVSNLPSFIYAVVNRQGTALSAFANTVDLQVSQDELSDYEANGVNYYVAKIATVNADGTVTDERTTSLNEQQFASLQNQLDDLQQQIDDVDADLQGHKAKAQMLPYSPSRTYKQNETCTTFNATTGELEVWTSYAPSDNLGNNPQDPANRHDAWANFPTPCWWIKSHAVEPGTPVYWFSDDIPENALQVMDTDINAGFYHRIAKAYPSLVADGKINLAQILGRYIRIADGGDYVVNTTHEDGIRDMNGSIVFRDGDGNDVGNIYSSSGVLQRIDDGSGGMTNVTYSAVQSRGSSFIFKASNSVPTADQVQPQSAMANLIIFI